MPHDKKGLAHFQELNDNLHISKKTRILNKLRVFCVATLLVIASIYQVIRTARCYIL